MKGWGFGHCSAAKTFSFFQKVNEHGTSIDALNDNKNQILSEIEDVKTHIEDQSLAIGFIVARTDEYEQSLDDLQSVVWNTESRSVFQTG